MVFAKTISIDGIFARLGCALLAGALVAGCEVNAKAPPCPFQGTGDLAPSAGCLSLENGKLLVVQGMNRKLSPPGGKARDGESAQCTAHRETWEETGLALKPTRLIDVFDTGFHLYQCERMQESGAIAPGERFEIRSAFYLAPDEFDDWDWRFPGQQKTLRTLIDGLREPPAQTGSE